MISKLQSLKLRKATVFSDVEYSVASCTMLSFVRGTASLILSLRISEP